MTSHVMGDPTKVITCGIAVAPVTDWRYYGENLTPVSLYLSLLSLKQSSYFVIRGTY